MDPIQSEPKSRFYGAEPIIVNGRTTFGRWSRPDWLKEENIASTDVLLVSIDQRFAGRPDLIAQEYYNDYNLEWVITMFNRPLNPLGYPKAGTTIKLPSKKIVFSNV